MGGAPMSVATASQLTAVFSADRLDLILRGPLEGAEARRAEERVGELLDSDALRPEVVLDLAGATRIEPGFLGWLTHARARTVRAGGRVVLSKTPPAVMTSLREAGLASLFDFASE